MASKNNNQKEKNSGVGIKATIFILFLVIIGATAGCLFSPTFNITDVTTSDGNNIKAAEILNAANIPMGVNILRINDSKILDRVENLPYVKSANLYRAFPSTVVIKYEERKPYSIIKYLESYAIIDEYGYVLEIKKENDLIDLPVIYGIDPNECIVGKKLEGTAMLKYENCAYLIETANKTNFNYKFNEINYNDTTNVKLYIKEKDIDVIYGNIHIEDIEEKLRHLASILEQLENKKGKIDMSNEDYLAKTVFTEKR